MPLRHFWGDACLCGSVGPFVWGRCLGRRVGGRGTMPARAQPLRAPRPAQSCPASPPAPHHGGRRRGRPLADASFRRAPSPCAGATSGAPATPQSPCAPRSRQQPRLLLACPPLLPLPSQAGRWVRAGLTEAPVPEASLSSFSSPSVGTRAAAIMVSGRGLRGSSGWPGR